MQSGFLQPLGQPVPFKAGFGHIPEAVGAANHDSRRIGVLEEVADGYRRPGEIGVPNSEAEALVGSLHLFPLDGAGYIAGYHIRLVMGVDAGLG